jgi:hypothetical protein
MNNTFRSTLLVTACLILLFEAFVLPSNEKKKNNNSTNQTHDTVMIWNGKTLDGLELILKKNIPAEMSYKIHDGILYFYGGQVGYFKTKEVYSNYKLHAEWRWPEQNENGNSGVLIHSQKPDTVWPRCIQVQFKKDNAGDLIAMNGAVLKESIGKPKETALKLNPSSEKQEGEWNSCDVTCSGDSIAVFINGLFQNKGTQCNYKEGTIGFQLEGKPIEFRNIFLIENK